MWSKILGFLANSKTIIVIFSLAAGALVTLLVTQYIEIKSLQSSLDKASEKVLVAKLQAEVSKNNLDGCRTSLNEQNKALEQTKVDLAEVYKKKEIVKTHIEYIKVPTRNAECEAKLKYYENLYKGLSNER